jgi:cysteine desulfurase / selenocysteine lyase
MTEKKSEKNFKMKFDMNFDKSPKKFPVKDKYIYLSHCGASPLWGGALKKERAFAEEHHKTGGLMFPKYMPTLDKLRESAAALMNTTADNMAFVKNTSEAMGMIANGYRFRPGDQVICYVHEYPANYYPWKLQERRGVELILLPDRDVSDGEDGPVPEGYPRGWSMNDLEALVTDRTKLIAISHVQFTSGFAADLKILGDFCRERGIDLVIDAAQSLGCLPVYPEEYNIAAVASSGWKWLMGPLGCGLFYTSPRFRTKLTDVNVGSELMQQGLDFLNHSWHPHLSARRFQYSTSPISLASALEACISDLFLRYSPEDIRAELIRLQDIFLKSLDRERFQPVVYPLEHRSGILALLCKNDEPAVVLEALTEKNIVCSERGGYLRIAPHFYNTDEELKKAATVLNKI